MLFAFRKPQLQTSLSGITFRPKIRSQRRGGKCAFTLAETLITLVIVGVIAAITVPTLITKYQKEQTVTRLKKTYSTLTQTTNRAIADNGPIETWEFNSTSSFAERYLYPYLSIASICTNSSNECMFDYKGLNRLSNYSCTSTKFYLSDGTFVCLAGSIRDDRKEVYTYVDINGRNKPNVMGKDIFLWDYWILAPESSKILQGKFIPIQYLSSRENIKNSSEHACNKNSNGQYCTALIMSDGWRIADDYPW